MQHEHLFLGKMFTLNFNELNDSDIEGHTKDAVRGNLFRRHTTSKQVLASGGCGILRLP